MRRCIPPENVSTRSLARSARPTRVENLSHPRLQRGPAQTVEMSLMPEVLVGGQLWINALRLKHDADLSSQVGGILRGIAAHDQGAAGGGNHQSRENSEQSSLSAAIGSEQSEQFRRPHVEGNSVQRSAIFVAVNQILYGNDGRGRRAPPPDRHRRVQRLLRPKETPRTATSLRHHGQNYAAEQ